MSSNSLYNTVQMIDMNGQTFCIIGGRTQP